MRQDRLPVIIFLLLIFSAISYPVEAEYEKIKLIPPDTKQNLTKIIQSRISKRDFKKTPLEKEQISLILWSAGGIKIDAITSATKTIPSAGATYPLEFYLAVGEDSVTGIKKGIYHYIIKEHALKPLSDKDIRTALSIACLNQGFIADAPVSIIIAAEYKRTTQRYGSRGIRYTHIEVGHSCQNIYLMLADLNLATVEVGAFDDEAIKNILGLKENIEPLIVMPIGYTR